MASAFCESDSLPLNLDDFKSKQYSPALTMEKYQDTEESEVNGHHYDGVNGNGIREDPDNHWTVHRNGDVDEDTKENTEKVNGHEADDSEETKEDESAAPLPYFGKTLVAPEYVNFQLADDNSQVEEKEDGKESNAGGLYHAENNEFEGGKASTSVEAGLPLDEQEDVHGGEYVCDVEDQVGEEKEKESKPNQEQSGIGEMGEEENKLEEDPSQVFQPELDDEQDRVGEREEMQEVNYTGNDDSLQTGGELDESEEKGQGVVEGEIGEDDGVDGNSDEGNEEEGGESQEVEEDKAQEDEISQENGAVDEVKSREETIEGRHGSRRYEHGANEDLGEGGESEGLGLEERRGNVGEVDDKAKEIYEEGACSDIKDGTTEEDRTVATGEELNETKETNNVAHDDKEVVKPTECADTGNPKDGDDEGKDKIQKPNEVKDKDGNAKDNLEGRGFDMEDDSSESGDEILEGGEEVEMQETDLEVDKSYDQEIVVEQEDDDDSVGQVQDENLEEQPDIEDVENERSGQEDASTGRGYNLERDDSLKVNVASPTPGMVTFASVESLGETEGEPKENDVGDDEKDEDQKGTAQGDSTNVTDEQDGQTAATTNGPFEETESEDCHTDQEVDEMDDLDERSESNLIDDSAGDECETNDANSEDEAKLDRVPKETGAESDQGAKHEETFIVYKRRIGQDEESDLSGRVKELGKMFEGGGPIFPKKATIERDQADGTPVSVRKFKAMFEQDRYCAEKARELGRREDSSGPPRAQAVVATAHRQHDPSQIKCTKKKLKNSKLKARKQKYPEQKVDLKPVEGVILSYNDILH